MTEDDKFAEEQAKLGREIALQELDDDALDMVSGGGTGLNCYGTSDCDANFKNGCDGESFHPNGVDMGEPYGCRCERNYGCINPYFCDECFN